MKMKRYLAFLGSAMFFVVCFSLYLMMESIGMSSRGYDEMGIVSTPSLNFPHCMNNPTDLQSFICKKCSVKGYRLKTYYQRVPVIKTDLTMHDNA